MSDEREPMPEQGEGSPKLRPIFKEPEFDRLLASAHQIRVFDIPLAELSREDLLAVIAYQDEHMERERQLMQSSMDLQKQLLLVRALTHLPK